ncbi:50S ribosomal protein L9 [Chryseobacterium sp. MYb264]|uniref:50S ribosomal protein L9 n=1 Tax=Chryseobacterium sp. MYb264 TaxID=2745153 RepID=UPI002E0EA230|nr:50S ribosomal protein L9 [Chryseobacterium sp. MYb264]
MKIILKQDVENLGLEFDTVNVKNGYARNFLIPQGFALLATPKNIAALEATLEARKEEEAKLIAAANAVVDQLKKTSITIPAKVGSGDKLFGSINNADLSAALAKAGVSVEKKYIRIPGNTIKRTGKVTANIRLHRNVEYNFEFDIVSDAPVEAPKPAAPKAKVEETPSTEEA